MNWELALEGGRGILARSDRPLRLRELGIMNWELALEGGRGEGLFLIFRRSNEKVRESEDVRDRGRFTPQNCGAEGNTTVPETLTVIKTCH